MSGTTTAIGLEVHAQLRTKTKMFCGCPVDVGAPANSLVCPVCLGLPGALPTINEEAVRLAIRAALALGFRVEPISEFVRKQYFYPDLPKGYQITQYAHPLARDGVFKLPDGDGGRRVRLPRLQLEEDAGKSNHDLFAEETALDFNRAGVPLIEIVTDPEIRTPQEARAFLIRLKQVLKHYAGVSDCHMEEGSLRVDANLSVGASAETASSWSVEIKNLNSFGNVERALAYEERRLSGRVRQGRPPERETRRYDASVRETRPLRKKEDMLDYRYLPEPDLPLLSLTDVQIGSSATGLPPSLDEVEARLAERYGLSSYDARQIARRPERAAYLEAAVGGDARIAKTAANMILGDLAAELKLRGGVSEADVLPPEMLGKLARLRANRTLSSTTASRALAVLLRTAGATPGDLDELIRREALTQIEDDAEHERWVRRVLRDNPEEVDRFRAGERRLLDYLMGEVMRVSAGRAEPQRALQTLEEALATVK
jgi:aspartyl-tRNA(Asn)/glutamyl-tRNA(Gln) amidotransferase subunit B